ncbi:amino acid adenylation domain-containing protein [Micromonospora sp. CA-263727]|uniref:amino acid adenylation domain-containing protein n=1 Tax=Micromonospora sp. CA-263727 TaxID=3239967 RepID=UPI003D8B559D
MTAWLPLTSAARGLYFAHQLDPRSPAYSTAEVVEICGPLDPAALDGALRRAYLDFEQLRIELRLRPEGPQQRVRPDPPTRLRVVDLRDHADPEAAADRLVRADVARPLDLDTGELVRTVLFRIAPDRARWYHCAHHVLLDGYGYAQLARRVAAWYGALVGGPPPAPVTATLADVVAEDRARGADPARVAADDEFWAGRLAGVGLSTLAGRVADPAPVAVRAATDLTSAAQAALLKAAQRHGVTWTDVATAACAAYLGRMAGLDEVRIGLPSMNRVVPGSGTSAAARTVCTAMNVLPVAARTGTATVGELTAQVRAEAAEVREHPYTRQEELARRLRRAGGGQLFGPQVNLLPFDLRLSFGAATGVVRNVTAGPVEDMTWCLRGVPGGGRPVRFEVDANPRLYPADDVRGHAERLAAWIETFAAADPADPVDALPLVTQTDRCRMLTDFAGPVVRRPATDLLAAFRAQRARTPHAPALRYEGRELTYAELDDRAARLAGTLRRHGVRPRDVVGVGLRRGIDLYVAVYALLHLGAVYLPADPDLPHARIAGMLADAGSGWLLTDGSAGLTGLAEAHPGLRVLSLDPGSPLSAGAAHPAGAGTSRVRPDDTAYVIFTSGSTGRPKGVRISHRAIDNRLAWMQSHFRLRPAERVLHKTPISFDVSIWELYWPLRVGGCVVIARPGGHRDPGYLARLMVDERISTVHFVPSMLRAFCADPASERVAGGGTLTRLVCSGEALTGDLVRTATARLGVPPTNLYGPTEAAVDVTYWNCDPERDGEIVPIGRPVWNTRAYVLDARRRLLPPGARGELYLAGVQLSDGYAGEAELTAQRFPADPFVPDERMYRTGDLASWRGDGALLYLGRVDDQLKIRGQRLEPGEVEAVLGMVPGAGQVAAVGAGDPTEPTRLVAYFTGTAPVAALRAAARDALPEAMRPAAYARIADLPLTPSGKVDRRALAARGMPRTDPTCGAAPGDVWQQQIGVLMAGLLGTGTALPADADFFDAGGDSLSALRLLDRIEAVLGRRLALIDVFTAPTPARLARAVAGPDRARRDLAEVLPLRDADGPPLFLLPPAGGLGWCYAPLLRSLPGRIRLIALQSSSFAHPDAALPADLDTLAAGYLSAIRSVVGDGPFHVAGWSIGGMAAHAVAASASAAGHPVGVVALLDAYPADQWRHLGEPTRAEALRGILRMAGAEHLVAEDATLDDEQVRHVLRASASPMAALPEAVLAASIRCVIHGTALVRHARHTRYPGDLLLFRAAAPRPEQWLDPAGWRRYARRVEVIDLPATHPDLVRAPAIDRIGAVLAERLGP